MVAGEPDARKRASPVRRGADGKRTSLTLEPRLSAYPAKVTDPEALASMDIPDRETAVEVPRALLGFAPGDTP
jgi:hypothetical protein